MGKITYEIVRHDGGWAYKVDETFSEADKAGHWHKEKSAGDDRPEAEVEG